MREVEVKSCSVSSWIVGLHHICRYPDTRSRVSSVHVFLGLPGRIAIARRHPEAEAVNLMGAVGFMAVTLDPGTDLVF